MLINVYWADHRKDLPCTHRINSHAGLEATARRDRNAFETLHIHFHGPEYAYRAECYKALIDLIKRYPHAETVFHDFPADWW